jgi:hypothetical protein
VAKAGTTDTAKQNAKADLGNQKSRVAAHLATSNIDGLIE